MFKHKRIFSIFSVSVLVLIFSLPVSVWAAEPTAIPTITGIDPSSAVPGQSVQIIGTNLSNRISLVSSGGQSTEITDGWVDENSLTTSGFEVPLDTQPGSYKITVTNTKGSATSTTSLTIKTSGPAFAPQTAPAPPTQGLTNLGQLIQQIFTWSLGILGISVFVIFFYSGFLWLTAAGNTAKVGEARTHMTNAVFGAILLLSSYLILYTINPDFVKSTVNLPGLKTTTPGTNPPSNGGSPNSVCGDKGAGIADYSGALRSAINAVLIASPDGIADALNTDANGFKILGFVADELKKSGFNATTNVKNGNDNPNQGDLIALWRSSDTTVERYDAIGASGAGNEPLKNKMLTSYTGDIPLSCVF